MPSPFYHPQGPGAASPVTGDGCDGANQILDNALDTFAPNERTGSVQAAQRFLECANDGMAGFNRTPGFDAATARVLDPSTAASVLPNIEITGDATMTAAKPMSALGGKGMSLFDASMSKMLNPGMTADLGNAFGGLLDSSANMPCGIFFKLFELLLNALEEIGGDLLKNIAEYEEAAVASMTRLKV